MRPQTSAQGRACLAADGGFDWSGAAVARTPIGLFTSANIGLAEVYGIIKKIDGEPGTTVRIMLPIAAD